MANGESAQKRVQKTRRPRVHMSYDVELGGALESKALPFVVGLVGDFGNDGTDAHKRLKARHFVTIDDANFDEVLAAVAPLVHVRVADTLDPAGADLVLELRFGAFGDFRPEAVLQQVPPLRRLLDVRSKLADLRNKLAGNEKLEDLLQDILTSTDKLAALHDAAAVPALAAVLIPS